MAEWTKKTLGEVTSFITKGIPPKYIENESNNTVQVLNQKCNRNFSISYTEARLHNNTAKKVPDKKMLKKGDVLINSTGTGTAGRIAQLWNIPTPTTIDGHMILLRPTNEIDLLYYGYAIKVHQKKIENLAEGSTGQTEINRQRLQDEIVIKYPVSLKTQHKIGQLLLNLDDKIELNNKINANLEQQAQAIFKSWFVDFEPFGGTIPETWFMAKLGDIASIKTTSFSPAKNPDVILEHYSIPAFDKNKYPVFELAKEVKSNKYILTSKSIMISKLNPNTKRVWRPMYLTEFAVSSTEFIIFEANNPIYKDFIYSIIDSVDFMDWMCAHTTGSTNSRQRTIPSTTLEFKVPIACDEIISEFCAIVSPMYDKISQNICENQKLVKIRDTLLPKLMSGEIDVSDITI